jgi:hypothetical protein
MKRERSVPADLPAFVVFLLLLAASLAFYWRHDLFFMWDDWTELDLIAHNSFWNYLTMPDGEIYFPFFHLVFYGLVKLSGEQYGIMVLVNCLGIGLVAFLFYLFLKRHFAPMLSLALGLFYAGTVAQQAIAWNAFYLSYILSLGFFFLALLLTDRYLRFPTLITLLNIGLCACLSIHSHNYTIFALLILPLYAALLGGADALRKSLALAVILGVVLFGFAWQYLAFVGLRGLSFYNHEVLSSFPGPAFLLHWFYGAFLAPVSFLFWGHYLVQVWAIIFGGLVWGGIIVVIFRLGGPSQRRLGLLALLINGLPFLMVSLGRHHISTNQAFMVRYVFFTLAGALLLAGIAWSILSTRLAMGTWQRSLSAALIMVMLCGQTLSIPIWQKGYLQLSRRALECYQDPGLFTSNDILWLTPHHPLEQGQLKDIRRFLQGPGRGQVKLSTRGGYNNEAAD